MSASNVPAAQDSAVDAPRVREVSPGIFAYIQPDGTWWINNTGFLVGRKGVVSVDSCSTGARTRAYRETIDRVAGVPVRTLVNTHHHGDHTFGNFVFSEATLVGHERTRDEVLANGGPPAPGIWTDVDWGIAEVEPPFLTFTDELSLYVDDLRCIVRHVGSAAHTTNDSVLWVPERSVLFTGDLVFNGGTPFVLMGSVVGSIAVLEELKAYGAEVVIPGHGDVCGPDAFDDVLGYLRYALTLAKDAKKAGVPPLDAAREADLSPWASLTDPERIVGNLYRAYADLDGGPLGKPIDTATALADMVTYNGGRPLTCHA
jgi:cyclase